MQSNVDYHSLESYRQQGRVQFTLWPMASWTPAEPGRTVTWAGTKITGTRSRLAVRAAIWSQTLWPRKDDVGSQV